MKLQLVYDEDLKLGRKYMAMGVSIRFFNRINDTLLFIPEGNRQLFLRSTDGYVRFPYTPGGKRFYGCFKFGR